MSREDVLFVCVVIGGLFVAFHVAKFIFLFSIACLLDLVDYLQDYFGGYR